MSDGVHPGYLASLAIVAPNAVGLFVVAELGYSWGYGLIAIAWAIVIWASRGYWY